MSPFQSFRMRGLGVCLWENSHAHSLSSLQGSSLVASIDRAPPLTMKLRQRQRMNIIVFRRGFLSFLEENSHTHSFSRHSWVGRVHRARGGSMLNATHFNHSVDT